MARSLISLSEIADIICEDTGYVNSRYKGSVMRHLANCYRDLETFVTNSTSVNTLVADANNVIDMPSDFIKETKVGIKQGDKVVLLKKNYDEGGSSLFVNQSQASSYIDGILAREGDYDGPTTPFYDSHGNIVFEGYGCGIQSEGLYSVDTKNGRILLGSLFPQHTKIVIEYISDGVSKGVRMVPIEMYDTLYAYGCWKLYFQRNDRRYQQSVADYDVAYYKLEQLHKFTPIDYIASLFSQEMHTINDRL